MLASLAQAAPARNWRSRRTRPGARWDTCQGRHVYRVQLEKTRAREGKTQLVPGIRIAAASVPIAPFLSRSSQMSSIAALEKRVKALEDDEDFAKPSYVPPPPAASSASSAEVDELRKENAKLQDLLAKERYRIKHLIRAIEAKS